MKTGIGYDIHRLEEGRKLIIGGVHIPYEKGLVGHSDADVLIHALVDAMLGAGGKGDIGKHFPDTDEKWKNANSMKLLAETHEILLKDFYRIHNMDCIIIAQEPKMSPHVDAMKENIKNVLNIEGRCINIKAKTNEYIDSIGKSEAIAAWVSILIE